MFKFLIISFLVLFLIYKLLGFFFRMLMRSSINYHQQQRTAQTRRNYNKKPSDGNVTVEYIPDPKKERPEKLFRGGEYIDYEEVK